MATRIRIGTAGWAIPRSVAGAFPAQGSALQRYAARFEATEVNSTFYRPHRSSTWARWVEATPSGFSFAVKAPKALTHVARLVGCEPATMAFLQEVSRLGGKLGPVLVQLPPSFAFDAAITRRFFTSVRADFAGALVCEPRHPSWFEGEADALLAELRVARAVADPAPHPGAGAPGGDPDLLYVRLHGSPDMYRSSYSPELLAVLADQLSDCAVAEAWCMFDNTTSGAAAANALALSALLEAKAKPLTRTSSQMVR